jgi:hypothetical protein
MRQMDVVVPHELGLIFSRNQTTADGELFWGTYPNGLTIMAGVIVVLVVRFKRVS